MCISLYVGFEWDHAKAVANLRKHGVDFADATGVLEDPRAVTRPDLRSEEERWVTVGLDLLTRVVVVVWTWRGQRVRLISARTATPGERRQYWEGHDAQGI